MERGERKFLLLHLNSLLVLFFSNFNILPLLVFNSLNNDVFWGFWFCFVSWKRVGRYLDF